MNSLLEAQSRHFRGGLAELFILSGAFKRPPLAVEESPSFRKEFFNLGQAKPVPRELNLNKLGDRGRHKGNAKLTLPKPIFESRAV